MDSFMEELLQTFQDEATEIFEGLDKNLLAMESTGDYEDIIQTVFRLIHTLKGSANMMSLTGTGQLAHALEDLLDLIRAGKIDIDHDLINLFFDTVDCLKNCVKAEISKSPLPEGHQALVGILRNETLRSKNTENNKSLKSSNLQKELLEKISAIEKEGLQVLSLRVHFDDMCVMKSAGAMLAIDSLKENYEILQIVPDPDSDEIEDISSFKIIFAANDKNEKEIYDAVLVPGMTEKAQFEEVKLDKASKQKTKESSKVLKNSSQETLRVNWEQLVSLMNYVEELFVGRAKFQQTIGEIFRENNKEESVSLLSTTYRNMDKLIGRIQEQVLDIRRVPLKGELNRFNRIVRDISMQSSKDVKLLLECEKVEIDRGQWEEIAPGVIDIIRILINKSIEDPQVRQSKGKDLKGKINIEGTYSISDILIDISDDGRGCDDNELVQLKYINENMKKIRGRFEIIKQNESSNLYRFRVPTNSSTVGVLLVQRDAKTYALSISAVREVVRFSKKDLINVQNTKIISYRGNAVPIRFIEEISGNAYIDNNKINEHFIGIVVHEGQKESIIEVDKIIGEDEILLKELRGESLQSKYIHGLTILGDGKVIIILNHRAFL